MAGTVFQICDITATVVGTILLIEVAIALPIIMYIWLTDRF